MLNKNLALGAILLMFSLHVAPASAINVEVIPSQPSLNVGEILTADVVISGLASGIPPSLAVFEIDLNFDISLFAPGAVTFGNQLDVLSLGSLQDTSSSGSAVNVFELSYDTAADLDTFQPASFLLFSVQFEALSAGVGVFDLSIIELGDAFGDELLVDLTTSATVEVLSPLNPVPVPAAVWLFGTALLGLVGFGRRKKVA